MKHIPRAEISTIQDVLYPLRKKGDPTWSRKNLEDLKELKQKVEKQREEKQKELENKPEPFKLKKFRNIPSKFMDTKDWIIKKQQNYLDNNKSSESIYIQNSHNRKNKNNNNINSIHRELNKSASIKKLPKIKEKGNNISDKKNINTKGSQIISSNNLNINKKNNESKSNNSINDLDLINHNNNIINNNKQYNTINNNEFDLEKELEKVPLEDGPSIFEKPINSDEEIEKLIKEYKEKYGDTEMIESLIKEFEEMKQKRKMRIELEQQFLQEKNNQNNNNININNINNNQINDNNNININKPNEEIKLKESIQKYEPKEENQSPQTKPPLPGVDDTPTFLLPKINRNYVKENIKLIVDNKIPQKKYVNNYNNSTLEEKHKNFGKVPEYIKKFEQEREIERQEKIRKQMEMKYPKGTRLLSEEERIKTLKSLKQAQLENSLLLEKMPITNRTFKLQQKKDELIRKLNEIDKAIEMFSKKQVFVKKQ